MLMFGTMYIFDENDRYLSKVINDDVTVEPCNEVIVPDGDRLNSVNSSAKHQNKSFEVKLLCERDILVCVLRTILLRLKPKKNCIFR